MFKNDSTTPFFVFYFQIKKRTQLSNFKFKNEG